MRGKKVMAVTLCALVLFGVLSFAFVSIKQEVALADEATFYSTDSDGHLYGYHNISYIAAHDAANAYFSDDFAVRIDVGQTETVTGYHIWRSALFFDTSSLPDSAVITAATLSLYGFLDASQTDFNITVVNGSLLNDPIVDGDYGDLLNETTIGGAINTAGFSISGYNDIPLNAIGMGWISKTGMTQFGLRSSRDIAANGTLPFAEWVAVHSYEQGVGYRPQLNVTYDTATPTPTINPTPTLTPTPTVTPTIPPTPTDVPTLSQWGMIGMAVLLAAFLVWAIRRRWAVRNGQSWRKPE